jgi:hypothetical protein
LAVVVSQSSQSFGDLESQDDLGLIEQPRASVLAGAAARDPARVEHVRIEMRRASVGAFTATA